MLLEIIDLLIDNNTLSLTKPKFDSMMRNWKYSAEKFRIARLNCKIKPYCLMVVLWKWFDSKKEILDENGLSKWTLSRPGMSVSGDKRDYSNDQIVKARSYQFVTGFMREIHLAQVLYELLPKCKVYKDLQADIAPLGAYDLRCARDDGSDIKIAITHKGSTSAFYSRKKEAKRHADAFILEARPSDGQALHLVDREDVLKLL